MRKTMTYIGDAAILQYCFLSFDKSGFRNEEEMKVAFVRHVTEMVRTLAYLIKLIGTHKNGVIIGRNKTDIARSLHGISVNTSLKRLNKLIEMGLVRELARKDGKLFLFAQLPTHFTLNGVKIKSKEKWAIHFNEDTKLSTIATSIYDAVIALHFSKLSYLADRIFRACLAVINDSRKKPRLGKTTMDFVGENRLASVLRTLKDVIRNGRNDIDDRKVVDVSKKKKNWKFNLIYWFKSFVSKTFCSRSYISMQKRFGMSRNRVAKAVRRLTRSGVLRRQYNYDEIPYEKYLAIDEDPEKRTFAFMVHKKIQMGKDKFYYEDHFCVRKPSSYVTSRCMRTGFVARNRISSCIRTVDSFYAGGKVIKMKHPRERVFVRNYVKRTFVMEEMDYRPEQIKRLRNKRYYFLAQHPEIRDEIRKRRVARRKNEKCVTKRK